MVNNHILQGINHDIKVIKFTPFSHTLVLHILPLNQWNNITFKYCSMINFNNSLYFFTLRFHYSTEPIYYVSLCFHTNFLFTKLSIFMLIVHFRTSPKPMTSLFTVYLQHILISLYQNSWIPFSYTNSTSLIPMWMFYIAKSNFWLPFLSSI